MASSSGTIGLQEFVRLWEYLDQWRGLFRRFDKDHSNAIVRGEYADALVGFGYRLSDKFINLLYSSYDKRGMRSTLTLFIIMTYFRRGRTNYF